MGDKKRSKKAQQVIDRMGKKLNRQMAGSLAACVHCGMCAEACLFYEATNDPKYTPIHKLEPMRRVWKQEYTFWGYYAPVYAEADINVRYEAVTNINLAAQYAAQGQLELAAYYAGYGYSLAATADLYNGSTIWCASMESEGATK